MKMDLIKDKDASEIKMIWGGYHLQKDVISAAIPPNVFDTITARSLKYPTFLFPLPRSEGYEFIICQFSKNTVHFTPLICYQVRVYFILFFNICIGKNIINWDLLPNYYDCFCNK